MHRIYRLLSFVVALAAAAVVAPPAGALVVRLPNGHRLGVMFPTGSPLAASAGAANARSGRVGSSLAKSAAAGTTGTLVYNGGAVLHTARPFVIFWDPSSGITPNSEGLIERYLTDAASSGAGASDAYGVMRQYYDSGGYAGSGLTYSAGTQALVDTQPYPTAGTCTVPKGYSACVNDSQVRVEISRLIDSKGWPTGAGAGAPIYFVVLPQSVDECAPGAGCADNSFCAYHTSYTHNSANVLYALVPFAVFNYGTKGCQSDNTSAYQSPNNDPADNIIDNLSHELNETLTDPFGDAWYTSGYGEEVADLCEAVDTNQPSNVQSNPDSPDIGGPYDPNAYLPTLGGSESAGTLYDQSINGHPYYTQTAWSDGANDCKTTPAGGTVTASFTAPATHAINTSVSFDGSATSATTGVSSSTWDFGDGATSFAAAAPGTASHTFTSAGTYTVRLTVVDANGNVNTAAHTVQVQAAPSNTALPSISGIAQQGQTLTLTQGTWSNQPTSISDQWLDCDTSGANCSAIPGAVGQTYELTSSDIGHTILVSELASNAGGTGGPALSEPTAVVAASGSSGGGSGSGGGTGTGGGTGSGGGTGNTGTGSTGTGSTGTGSTATASTGTSSTSAGTRGVGTPLVGQAHVSGISAAIPISCTGGVGTGCTLRLTLTVSVQVRLAGRRTKTKTVVVGSATVRLSAGQSVRVKLSLNRTGTKLLTKQHKLKAKLVLIAGGKTLSIKTVIFKRSPRRSARRDS